MSESDRRFSFFLYNAVTQNDYDSMLRIYASYAIEGIESREFTLNPRFDSHYYRSKGEFCLEVRPELVGSRRQHDITSLFEKNDISYLTPLT